jgi:hypothetical protein
MKKKIPNKSIVDRKAKLKSIKGLTLEVQKIIEWNKKGIGLSSKLQRVLKQSEIEMDDKMAVRVLTIIEKDSIIQEMFEWFHKVNKLSSDNELIIEINNIIEAFFDILSEQFNVSIIQEPNSIIATPSPRSIYYRFDNKFSKDLKFAKVIKSGLKIGNTVISPCIVFQIKNN